MPNWFKWNGALSTAHGLYVKVHPSFVVPDERVNFVTIPGRSGTLTQIEGDGVYNDFIASVECFVPSPASIPGISLWLRGAGEVVFANQPDVFFKARVVNQIEFAKVMRGRPHSTCIVNFRCAPYRYLPIGNEPLDFPVNNSVITNSCAAPSEPLIRVNGSGDITLMIGGQIVGLLGVDGYIILDTALKEAYTGVALANHKMIGDFPLLHPGMSMISWSGVVTSVQITPRWRNL